MTRALVALLLTMSVALVQAQQPPSSSTVTGRWLMTLDMSMGTASPTVTITQNGDKITGTYTGRYGTFDISGRVRGRAFEFSFLMNEEHPVSMCFSGEITTDGKQLSGTAVMAELGEATWTAVRDAGGPRQ